MKYAIVFFLLFGCGDMSTYPPDGYDVYGGDTTWADDFSIVDMVGSITAVADAGGGDIRVTVSAAHDLLVGQYVRLYGMSVGAYDGEYTVTGVTDTTHFDVTVAYSATATGKFVANKCGPDSIRFENTTPSDDPFYYYTESIPVEEGRPYRIQAVVQASSIAAGNTVRVWINWRGADDTTISNSDIHNAVLAATGTWYVISGVVSAPAGARYMRPGVGKNNTAFYLWLDDIALFDVRSAAHAYRAAARNIGSALWTHIPFDTEVHNYGSMYVDTVTGAITAYADAGGGQVTVTSNAHGLNDGDLVQIYSSTNYDEVYLITNVTTNTFEITATWAGDDGASNWEAYGCIVIPHDGIYTIMAAQALTVPVDTFTNIRLYKNNAQWINGYSGRQGGAAGNVVTFTQAIAPDQYLSRGDIIDARIYHDSGGLQALGVGSTGNLFTATEQ